MKSVFLIFNGSVKVLNNHKLSTTMEAEKLNAKRQQTIAEQNRLRRIDIFNQNRKIPTISKAPLYLPSYLKHQNPISSLVITSMQSAIPNPLPPLAYATISYYRRANRSVWLTKDLNLPSNSLENLHLLHESLWMLTIADKAQYNNYQEVVTEFENDFRNYLQHPCEEIKELAIIAAGNHAIGREVDVLSISQESFWVLKNHIIESRLPFTYLFPFILKDTPQAYQALYELSEFSFTETLLEQQHSQILFHLVNQLNSGNTDLSTKSLRIIGNLLSSQQQFVDDLIRLDIVKELYSMLAKAKRKTKQEVCWALSNIAFGTKGQATHLLHHTQLLGKLMDMICVQASTIREQIIQIFTGLVTKAEPASVFRLLQQQQLLRCLSEQRSTVELQPSLRKIIESIIHLVKCNIDESQSEQFIQGLNKYHFDDFLPDTMSIEPNP